MNRVFMFSYQNCQGNTGGGQGGQYRLYIANKKYKKMDNIYFIFGDRVLASNDECNEFSSISKNMKVYNVINKVPNFLVGILKIVRFIQHVRIYSKWLEKVNYEHSFDKEDLFFFHDIESTYAFTKKYGYKKIVMVHHGQGSQYNEWVATSGRKSKILQMYYMYVYKCIIKKLLYLAFPSYGAKESLINSEPGLKNVVNKKETKILYTGIECVYDIKEKIDKDKPAWINELEQENSLKFVTIANLNAAKAVERIPEYLAAVRDEGIAFKWILIGNGVKAENVKENIKKYNLESNVVWIQDSVKHDFVLYVLSLSDFYILFHKYSIFDLSTLEAMQYGCIPILTPVGGNMEVIIENNGLLVSDFKNIKSLIKIIKEGNLEKLKQVNIKIQREYFNDEKFIDRYCELCKVMYSMDLEENNTSCMTI